MPVNIKSSFRFSFVLLFNILLLILLCAFPAFAQMGSGGGPGQGMGPGMMHGFGFEQFDSRFADLGSATLEELSGTFGVPLDVLISDLGLPEGTNPELTVMEIEEQYGVSGEEIASYLALNMRRGQISLNAREWLLMRRQASETFRAGGIGRGLYFMRHGRFAYGNFTTFSFDKENGVIENFAVAGDLIFDSVSISNFDFEAEQASGAAVFYQGTDSEVRLHDNPMGVLQVLAFGDKTVVFDLADGVEAVSSSELPAADNIIAPVRLTKNNFEGYLLISRNYLAGGPEEEPLSGPEVEISGEKVTVVLVENSLVMFRASPMPPAFMQTQYRYSSRATYMHQVLNREITGGRVGAEIAFRANGDMPSVVNYSALDLRVRSRARDRIVLGLSSDLPEGRVITVNVDNETFDLSKPERLRFRLDGEVVEKAESPDELFAGGGPHPLCYLLQENDTALMAVYIPEFSERELVIELGPDPAETEEEEEEEEEEEDENATETEAARDTESSEEEEAAESEGDEAAEDDEKEEGKESAPAFEFGIAVLGLAAAYGIGRRYL